MKLWNQLQDWKESCTWVDLSRQVSADTPHFSGFPSMSAEKLYDVLEHGFTVYSYNIVGQYGTHVDAPNHFVHGAAELESIEVKDMVMPLCVVDCSAEAAANPDFALTKEFLLAWEEKHGKIPEGAFVAMRTDWYKNNTMDEMLNADANGQAHYPGWDADGIRFLVEERNIASIGHEPCDTDPAVVGAAKGYPGELYILSQNRFQIELLANLDKCPATGALIFCTFPNVKGATGFTARCFALCEK